MKKRLLKRFAPCFATNTVTLSQTQSTKKTSMAAESGLCEQSMPLFTLLSEYYGVPIGRKKLTSTISGRVTNSWNPEVKFAALAGMLSSDGYVNCNRRNYRFGVNAGLLTTVSAKKARAAAKLVRTLGFHCYVSVSTFQNPFTRRSTTSYNVVVNRRTEVVALFFRLFPYLLKPPRDTTLDRLAQGSGFLSTSYCSF